MSASFALPEQVDGLEKLLVLASLKKEDIAANAAEARKQYNLTAELKAQWDEAKAAVATHAATSANLQQQAEALAAEKASHAAEHTKKMAALDERISSENKRLEAFSAQLDARKSAQDATETKQAAESARLASIAANQSNEHAEAMRKAAETLANAKAIETANITEQQRLKEWDDSLKAKAARLREQIANF